MIQGVNHSSEISKNPYMKSEISYALDGNPFEKPEISYAYCGSDLPLALDLDLFLVSTQALLSGQIHSEKISFALKNRKIVKNRKIGKKSKKKWKIARNNWKLNKINRNKSKIEKKIWEKSEKIGKSLKNRKKKWKIERKKSQNRNIGKKSYTISQVNYPSEKFKVSLALQSSERTRAFADLHTFFIRKYYYSIKKVLVLTPKT